ncbi:MAG: glycosyltransferase family protein, partial [Planctomycetota bacterium]
MNIVFFTAVRFDSMISGRTKQLAAEIAAIGHDVWFVEMPSLRNLRFPPLQVSKRCRINVITLPPFPMSHKLINTPLGAGWRKVVVAFLQKQFSNFQDVHCIVSNPWWEHLLNGKPFGSLSYDYIDHVSVHCQKKHEKKMRDWEKKLLDNCDNIFIVRDTLKNEIQNSTAKQILLVPNGVPADWLSIKSDMSSGTQRPRIGFVGSIYEWIDQKLICSVAKACP